MKQVFFFFKSKRTSKIEVLRDGQMCSSLIVGILFFWGFFFFWLDLMKYVAVSITAVTYERLNTCFLKKRQLFNLPINYYSAF